VPKPTVITQAEIEAAVAAYEAIEKNVLRIRRLLRAGAIIETGALECHLQSGWPFQINQAAAYSPFGLEIRKRYAKDAA
jgi:hypothetical protein